MKQSTPSPDNLFRNIRPPSPQKHFLNYKDPRMPSLDCSDVKDNVGSQQMLGASQVSWLQKMGQQGLWKRKDNIGFENGRHQDEEEQNSLRFSFNGRDNQNDAVHLLTKEACSRQHTFKQIYYQEFEKQSNPIKTLQQQRQVLFDSLNNRKKDRLNFNSRQNMVGSIRRAAPLAYVQSINNQKDQEDISLKYLQDSLAKKESIKVPLSKQGYLEQNKTIITSPISDSDGEISKGLSMLFDELDGYKAGRIFSTNCNYSSIQEQFKIIFGYVLCRVIYKDLILNRQEFISLGFQVLKELNSQQVQNLIKTIRTARLSQKKVDKNLIKKPQGKENNYQHVQNSHQQNQHKKGDKLYKPEFNMDKEYQSAHINMDKKNINFQKQNSQFQLPYFQNFHYPDHNSQIEKHILNQYQQNYQKLKKEADNYNQHLQMLKQVQDKEISPSLGHKIRNISQEMILEHKKTLEYLIRLNQTMENYLSRSRKRIDEISAEKGNYYSLPPSENTLMTDRYRHSEWLGAQ